MKNTLRQSIFLGIVEREIHGQKLPLVTLDCEVEVEYINSSPSKAQVGKCNR